MINRICKIVANDDNFNYLVLALIVLNSILIGVETSYTNSLITITQHVIIILFVFELIIRWLGKDSVGKYFRDGWNWFDIVIVSSSLIPFGFLGGHQDLIIVFRILRVFRIFRSIRVIPELQLIATVLLKSLESLACTAGLTFIFMYVYAIIGVTLFRSDNYSEMPNASLNPTNPDPYGNLGEAFFTLFRIVTGEDWTDVRYNLLNTTATSNFIVTFYHVSWMFLASFLLVNLIMGAVVNNYDKVVRSLDPQDQ